MHKTAKALMEKLLGVAEEHNRFGAAYNVLDVGSRWINGSYREMVEAKGWSYTGLDIVDGGNVDILCPWPYDYPIDDESFDLVISGSTMEHVPNLHRWTKELMRMVRPAGWLIVLTVNEWPEHKHPVDCWRILGDGMSFVLTNTHRASRVEVGTSGRDTYGIAIKHVDWMTVEGAVLLENERRWLHNTAQYVSANYGAEARMATIGVWRGASMYCLRSGCPQGELIGVDKDLSTLWASPELGDVTLLEADSRECHEQVDGPLHLLLIDSDHHREVIEKEIEYYTPKVAYDGIVVFHDYNPTAGWVRQLPHLADVRSTVNEWLLATRGQYIPLPTVGSLAAFRRIAE